MSMVFATPVDSQTTSERLIGKIAEGFLILCFLAIGAMMAVLIASSLLVAGKTLLSSLTG